MGLPHVVVRFYTNPDGRAARRTTLVVLGLLGVFYLLPPVYAALGRVYAPELAGVRHADVLVLELPRLMVPGLGGELLTGPGDRRRVRGVPLDLVRAWRSRSRACSARTSPAGASATGDSAGSRPSGSARCSPWWCRASLRAVQPQRRRRPHGRARVRRGRVDVLPAAPARHLVARADRRRRGRRAAGRRTRVGRGRRLHPGQRDATGWDAVLLGQPAAWSVPAALVTMVVVSRLTRSPGAGAHRPVHGPAAHAGGGGPGPGVDRSSHESDRSADRPPPLGAASPRTPQRPERALLR